MKSVAIIIRAFNEEAHIGRLLTGIHKQMVQPDEVILVDSGSTDSTVAIAEAFGATVVGIAREEFSFGRALNRGIGAASSDLVVLASAHVYPLYKDWLERLLTPFDEYGEVGLSFGRQLAPTDSCVSERRILESWFPLESRIDRQHPFCNNANAAIRRELWLGHPYDEQLTGLEDLAWAKRLLASGGSLAYVAEAPVVHVHDEAFPQIVSRYRREALAYRTIFPEQSPSVFSAAYLGARNITGDVVEAARGERKLRHETPSILRFRLAQFYGMCRGMSERSPVTDSLLRRLYYPPDGASQEDAKLPSDRLIDYDAVSETAQAGPRDGP